MADVGGEPVPPEGLVATGVSAMSWLHRDRLHTLPTLAEIRSEAIEVWQQAHSHWHLEEQHTCTLAPLAITAVGCQQLQRADDVSDRRRRPCTMVDFPVHVFVYTRLDGSVGHHTCTRACNLRLLPKYAYKHAQSSLRPDLSLPHAYMCSRSSNLHVCFRPALGNDGGVVDLGDHEKFLRGKMGIEFDETVESLERGEGWVCRISGLHLPLPNVSTLADFKPDTEDDSGTPSGTTVSMAIKHGNVGANGTGHGGGAYAQQLREAMHRSASEASVEKRSVKRPSAGSGDYAPVQKTRHIVAPPGLTVHVGVGDGGTRVVSMQQRWRQASAPVLTESRSTLSPALAAFSPFSSSSSPTAAAMSPLPPEPPRSPASYRASELLASQRTNSSGSTASSPGACGDDVLFPPELPHFPLWRHRLSPGVCAELVDDMLCVASCQMYRVATATTPAAAAVTAATPTGESGASAPCATDAPPMYVAVQAPRKRIGRGGSKEPTAGESVVPVTRKGARAAAVQHMRDIAYGETIVAAVASSGAAIVGQALTPRQEEMLMECARDVATMTDTMFGPARRRYEIVATVSAYDQMQRRLMQFVDRKMIHEEGAMTFKDVYSVVSMHVEGRGSGASASPTLAGMLPAYNSEELRLLRRRYFLKLMLLFRTLMLKTPAGRRVLESLREGPRGHQNPTVETAAGVVMESMHRSDAPASGTAARLSAGKARTHFAWPRFRLAGMFVLREGIAVPQKVIDMTSTADGRTSFMGDGRTKEINDMLTPRPVSTLRTARLPSAMMTPTLSTWTPGTPVATLGRAASCPVLQSPLTPRPRPLSTGASTPVPAVLSQQRASAAMDNAPPRLFQILQPDPFLAATMSAHLFKLLGIDSHNPVDDRTVIKDAFIEAAQTRAFVSPQELVMDMHTLVEPYIMGDIEPPWLATVPLYSLRAGLDR